MAEQLIRNEQVDGSIPFTSSKKSSFKRMRIFSFHIIVSEVGTAAKQPTVKSSPRIYTGCPDILSHNSIIQQKIYYSDIKYTAVIIPSPADIVTDNYLREKAAGQAEGFVPGHDLLLRFEGVRRLNINLFTAARCDKIYFARDLSKLPGLVFFVSVNNTDIDFVNILLNFSTDITLCLFSFVNISSGGCFFAVKTLFRRLDFQLRK